MSEEPLSRHLSRASLQEYLSSGVTSVIKLDGKPVTFLVVDPNLGRISLRAPRDSVRLPDLGRYDLLNCESIHWDGQHWYQLTIVGPAVNEAFPLLADVSDRIQLQGQSFEDAVEGALRSLHNILAVVSRMSVQQEVGLLGELIVLDKLITHLPEAQAVESWRGWDKSEHDFDLGDIDLEVKTTLAERRRHRISSATQLAPSPGRNLWLGSFQLTVASERSSDAIGLTSIVRRIDRKIKSPAVRADLFDRLTEALWTELAASHYVDRFRIRSEPKWFLVDDEFPAITLASLNELGAADEIIEVAYTLDLSGRVAPEQTPQMISVLKDE